MSDAVYVVSDIHLGAVPASTEQRFRRFLQHLRGRAGRLLINGDLFDFWFEYRTVIPAQHFRVLAALAELRESGTEILFLGGNHDAWGGDFLRQMVGIELLDDAAEIELAGRRALVVHGDGRGAGDLGYRILKRVIRHPLSILAFRTLHPDWGSRLAGVVSTTEGKHADSGGANVQRAAELARWGRQTLAERQEIGMVLTGHTHTPVVEEVAPGRYYINTGDWIHHFTYLHLEPGAPPELRRWE